MMDAHQMIAAAALHCSVSTTSPTAALVSDRFQLDRNAGAGAGNSRYRQDTLAT